MLKYTTICGLLVTLGALTGCSLFSNVEKPTRVHDIHIDGTNSIRPLELYATVGEEIRWHNQLSAPIHLGLLGVNPIGEIRCDKGFKTWFGTIKEMVTIPAGGYVSVCFQHARTIQYNIWTDLADPFRSMSPTAVIHLDERT